MDGWILSAVSAGLLAAGVLTGCQSHSSERIQTTDSERETAVVMIDQSQQPEQSEMESADLVIELETESESADLVIEQNEEDESHRFLFAGDVLLSDHVLNAYEKAGDSSGVLDENYRKVIEQADFFMVNQEFPFSSRGTAAADKQYTFRLPPDRVSLFQELGIDGVTLANNHGLDYGQEALLDSCQVLDQAGILHTGAGEDLNAAKQAIYLKKEDPAITVIGATRVIPETGWAAGVHHPGMLVTYDPSVLLEEIRRHSEAQEMVIVFVHWGIERDEMPQEYQRNLARQYIDAGADLVIGAHPHVLQGIEYYQGKPIVYSLGNFIFGSSIPRTMLLEVTVQENRAQEYSGQENTAENAAENAEESTGEGSIAEGSTGDFLQLRLFPGTSAAGFTRMYTEDEKRQEFFRYIEGISFGIRIDSEGLVSPER